MVHDYDNNTAMEYRFTDCSRLQIWHPFELARDYPLGFHSLTNDFYMHEISLSDDECSSIKTCEVNAQFVTFRIFYRQSNLEIIDNRPLIRKIRANEQKILEEASKYYPNIFQATIPQRNNYLNSFWDMLKSQCVVGPLDEFNGKAVELSVRKIELSFLGDDIQVELVIGKALYCLRALTCYHIDLIGLDFLGEASLGEIRLDSSSVPNQIFINNQSLRIAISCEAVNFVKRD